MNLHASRRYHLKVVRLPIPPPGRGVVSQPRNYTPLDKSVEGATIARMRTIGVVVMCMSLVAPAVAAAQELRVMTFNIRYANLKDGENAWPLRRELLFQTIEKFDPDLLGLQEVVLLQREEFRQRFKEYELLGVGRIDGKDAGEHASVLFKRERFEKVRDGNFWLSETPEIPGSKGWDADLPRICSWVALRDRKAGGKPIVFFNTHWDHLGVKARAESAKLMRARVAEIAGDKPVIITGDFNTRQDSPPYRELLGDRFIDAFAEMHPNPTRDDFTAHNFTGKNPRGDERIDWILRSHAFRTKSADIDRTNDNGRYPSDHFPVVAVFEWND